MPKSYDEFLKSKVIAAPESGFDVSPEMMNQNLFEWQRDIVRWAMKKGKAALFEDCGLGKTIQQLEFADKVSKRENKPVLIVAPLAVADQTRREGKRFGYEVTVCRTQKDVQDGINITNYEMLEHFDASAFGGIVLDESSILKNYSGTIRTQIIEMFRQTPYKLSCTATPAPNDYMELGNQAEFLGVMSRTEMLSTFFVHDGGETSKWRLKGHAEQDFWKWLATWAVVLTSPADLGYPADGYDLPGKITTEHTVSSEQETAVGENVSMFTVTAKTLTERRGARRESLEARCKKAADLVAEKPDEQWLIWCDLNDESGTLARMIENSVEVRGSDSPDYKARMLNGFTVGEVKYLISKPSIAGFGLNWQNCHNMIFVGLSDSYEMMYQAVRRCWRFGQLETVHVHIVTSEAEGAVKENIERKERQAERMTAEMVRHTKDILEQEIRGTIKVSIPYDPQMRMVLPEWLRSA